MRKCELDPDQITLPLEIEAPAKARANYQPRKISVRREHAGAPALGVDYGYDFPDDSECDSQDGEAKLVPIIYFDFESVYRHLDGDHAEDARAAVLNLAAEAMAAMTEWLQEQFVSKDSGIAWRLDTTTRCKLALLSYYRNPSVLGVNSLTELANQLGISKQRLDVLWADFKQRFPGVVARWEKSAAAKKSYRQAHKSTDGDN